MSPEPEPKLQERYPYFAYVGGVGVGKSESATLLHQNFGLPLFEEEFVDNPYLPPFYTVDPKKYAFDCQMFFLGVEVNHMKALPQRLTQEPVGHDQPPIGDAFFESILWSLDYISDEDHRTYQRSYDALTGKGLVPRPDIYLGLTSSPETAVKRIIDRGREMELIMHEKHPYYFPTIVKAFNSWLKFLSRHYPVITIDTDACDIVNDDGAKEYILNEIRHQAGYYLYSPNQMNGLGADGSHLIIPDFLKPRPTYSDITPGLPTEQKMLQRR